MRAQPWQWVTAAAVVTMVGSATPACGQGTAADYERAAGLAARTRDKLIGRAVEPHWLDGGGLWYERSGAQDTRTFWTIDPDAAAPAPRPLFDHDALAKALAGRGVDGARADELPIRILSVTDGAVRMTIEGRPNAWAFADGVLAKIDWADAGLERLPHRPRLRRSGDGPRTNLVFLNATDGPVELVWLDRDGTPRSYGTLAAGASRSQSTFVNHAWLIRDAAGTELARFRAEADPRIAFIDAAAPPPRAAPAAGPDRAWRVTLDDDHVVITDRDGNARRVTTDDGTADTYRGPVRWSPDGRHFVVMRVSAGGKRQVHYVESAPKDQLQPKLHAYDYLKPGDEIPHPRPCLFDAETARSIPIDPALFPNPWAITDLAWAPDGASFSFLTNERGHQTLRVVSVDAATGATRAVVDETSPTFIDYAGKRFLRRLDATNELIWMSERDGWNHLYLYDQASGRVKHQITRGPWVVRGVDFVDEDARQIWFRAGGIHPDQDPYHVHFARVNFDGSGLVALTSSDGTHTARFSPDRRYVLAVHSRADLPPVSELRRTADGALIAELERADDAALRATGWRSPLRFTAKGRDGTTDIWGIIHRPTNFDPGRSYPVIESIYAGPHSAHVPKSFRAHSRQRELAELGFVVVQIDGMGTSHRSKAFHDVCWRNLKDAGFPDRIRWLQAAAARYPWMSIERVGIYGGSAGGQSAMGALLFHNDVYAVAVADCGCHDNRMDKIWWNELWMGWPIGPHYAASSNVDNAHRLEGDLLLIVGEGDRNVDPASTMQVVAALVAADKDFELLVMPGVGHGAAGTPYARRRQRDFFVRRLLGVEPRRP